MTGKWSEAALRAWADELGFARCSLCRADDFDAERRAVETGEPIRERRQLRFSPREDYPRAKSLAVLLMPYAPARIEGGDRVFVDSYYDASNAAYRAAREIERRALECGGFAAANVPYPAREAAVRAGLGEIGKNGLLISPGLGTRTVVILLSTDLPAPEAPAKEAREACGGREGCMDCGRCRAACPAGAIGESGLEHPERCLRNFMFEGVVVPEALRERMGMRLVGCDICQRVCPAQPEFPADARESVPLSSLVTADERAFTEAVRALASRIGKNAARPQRVRAQAALLAGNLGDASLLPALRAWADSPFEAVREHARWAIRRIEARAAAGSVPPEEREKRENSPL